MGAVVVVKVTDKDRDWMLRTRQGFGMSKAQVAKRIGYNAMHYSRVENGYLSQVKMAFFNRLNELYRTNYKPEDSTPVTHCKSQYTVPLSVEYCEWMYDKRMEHGLTMREVANSIGCTAPYYSRLEDRAVRRIGTQYVEKLEALYGEPGPMSSYILTKGGD